MGNNPVSTVDPDGGKTSQLGLGSTSPEVEYNGRTRPDDPFDHVGGSGTREESYGWRDGKLISLEDDPYSPYTLEEQINGRISGISNGTGSSNSNPSVSPNTTNPNDNLVASSDNDQALLMLLGGGIEIEESNKGNDIESILRNINSLPIGSIVTGEEIGEMNNKLSLAEEAINNIEKVKGGLKVNISWKGIGALKLSPHKIPDGSVFKIESVKLRDNSSAIRVSYASARLFGNPFNIYIRKNSYSFYGISFEPIFK